MKKLFTSLVMLAAMLCSTTAWAQTYYGIKVAGIKVTSSNASSITGTGISGSVSYDATNKRLKLTNATISASGSNDGIYNEDCDGLSIIFSGTCKVSTSSTSTSCAAIYCSKSTSLSNWIGESPTVTLSNTGAGAAILCYETNLYVYGENITATASNYNAIKCAGSGGGYLSVNFASIYATAASGYAAITGFTGGSNIGSTSVFGDSSHSLSNGTVVSGGSAVSSTNIYAGVTIGNLNIGWDELTLTTTHTGASSASGKAKFSSNTLTLTDATVDGKSLTCRIPGMKIVTNGTCSITSNSQSACYIHHNLSFEGSGTLKLTSTAANYSGICVFNATDVTIKMKEIQVQGGSNGYGIDGVGSGKLIMEKYSDACVYKFVGGKSNIFTGNLVMNDMDISTTGAYWNKKDGYVYRNGEIHKGTSITSMDATWFKPTSTINYIDLTIDGVKVKRNNSGTETIYCPALTSGTITYTESSKTVTLNGVTMTAPSGDNNTLFSSWIEGNVTFNLIGSNTITSNGDLFELVYGGYTTTFTGSGNLEAVVNSGSGITTNQNIIINNTSLFRIKASGAGFWGDLGATLTMKKTSSDDTGFVFDGAAGAVINVGNLVLDGMAISNSGSTFVHGCYFDSTKHQVCQNGGTLAKGYVSFKSIKEHTGIFIAGQEICRVNDASYVIYPGSPYITAGGGNAVAYAPNTKTLTLTGATIAAPSSTYGIQTDEVDNLMITTTGTSKITASAAALRLAGNTTIAGTGNFTIESTGESAIDMRQCGGSDTGLKLNCGGGTLEVIGKDYGYYGYKSTALEITKAGSGCIYKFAGANANIYNTQLKLGEGVGINTRYTWFNEDQNAMYKNDTYAKAEDIDQGTWIRSDLAMTAYDLYIAGTRLYSLNDGGTMKGNVWGFCNKYYQGDGISYDPSTKTLTLNNAKFDVSSIGSNNGIKNLGIDGLVIKVIGDCEVAKDASTSGWSSLNLQKNTTIKGSGTLKLPGAEGDIYGNGCTVTIEDVNVEAEGDIYDNNSAMLVISLADASKTVKAAKGIHSWNSITLENGATVVAPSGAAVDGGAVKAGGSNATNVVIQHKAQGYDLKIAGQEVNEDNCGDILGDGKFKYDDATKTLTIKGDYSFNDWIVNSSIEGLTINIASNSKLTQTSTGTSIIRLYATTTITGGKLTLDGYGMGIYLSSGDLTIKNADIEFLGTGFEYGITGEPGCNLSIINSNITAIAPEYGAICDWSDVTLSGCYIDEPRPYLFNEYAIRETSGNKAGTVVIKKGTDAVEGIEVAETPTEIYDVAGRKLNETRRGINIVRSGDKTVKILKK